MFGGLFLIDSSFIRYGLLTILPNGILVLSINIVIDHLMMIKVFRFLISCSRVYKPLSLLVRWSVSWSVGPSVITRWHDKTIWVMETISNDTASVWCCVYSIVTAPAQQHETKPSIYTALFWLTWKSKWGLQHEGNDFHFFLDLVFFMALCQLMFSVF